VAQALTEPSNTINAEMQVRFMSLFLATTLPHWEPATS